MIPSVQSRRETRKYRRERYLSQGQHLCLRKRACAKGLAWRAVDHELEIDVMVREVEEVASLEGRLELPRKLLGVIRTDAKRDQGARVAENGMLNLRLHLLCILF